MRICTKCKASKEPSDFHKHKGCEVGNDWGNMEKIIVK